MVKRVHSIEGGVVKRVYSLMCVAQVVGMHTIIQWNPVNSRPWN